MALLAGGVMGDDLDHHLIPTIALFYDAVGLGGPDEGLGFALVLTEVPVYRSLQVDQRMKGAALQTPAGE